MSSDVKQEDKVSQQKFQHYEEDILTYLRLAAERAESPIGRSSMEQEKRIRREIANSNERRRMQSINAGFQSLRTLLPHHEGEKLSKAAILQQTAEYIYQLEQEKTRLLSQNCHLKRLLNQQEGETTSTPHAPKKRKPEEIVDATTGSLLDVRAQLDRERRLRMMLEDQVRSLEAQLYPERIREIAHKVQLQYTDDNQPQVVDHQVGLQPVAHTETVIATTASPPPVEPRLPSVLEAVIKAEPKVEVERLPTPSSLSPESDRLSQARVYLASTSRQNLETIVEAIRHLEGDNLFSETGANNPTGIVGEDAPQDAPLALTKTQPVPPKVKMNQYLQFAGTQVQQQTRPGVIVVKQHT